MPNSDTDSDTFADDDPIHLDDGVLAILDGATSYASSEASLPIGSSEPDASEDEHKPIISKNKTMKLSSIEAEVDEEGFPLMSLTQEEASVLKAVEEEYQLSQAPKRESPVEDYDLRWFGSQLGGKRQRPIVRSQFKEPAPVRGLSSSNIQRVKFEAMSQVDNNILVIADDETSEVPFKRPAPIIKRARPSVASEPVEVIEILSSDEEDKKPLLLGLDRDMQTKAGSRKASEPPAKRRKLDLLSTSKSGTAIEVKDAGNEQLRKAILTQPMNRPVQPAMARQSLTQATSSARSSFSLSAMVALWKDADALDEESEPEDADPPLHEEKNKTESTPASPTQFNSSATVALPSATPLLDKFFSQYPTFDYKPSAPAGVEFARLSQAQGWRQGDWRGKEAREDFETVMIKQFNAIYGLDENSLEAWQFMLNVLRVEPIPTTLDECKAVISTIHVNLVDLVDVHRSGEPVHLFANLAQLRAYTRGPKVFRLQRALEGGIIKFLLRRIRR
ncbi:unnamed protein product [Somion occarium]|uniref:Uncharacterized protein n=1 Tax=Somion occarium TaxID=3059160 RepID=A0ABP1CUS2_9APHY